MIEVMSKLIYNQTFLTIISGVIVYILCQLYLELISNPSKEYKRIKQKIIYALTMYSCYYCNPYDLLDEQRNIRDKSEYDGASKEMRKIGSELSSYIGIISKFRIRKKEKLKIVLDNLISISNGFFIVSRDFHIVKENKKCEKIIRDKLEF